MGPKMATTPLRSNSQTAKNNNNQCCGKKMLWMQCEYTIDNDEDDEDDNDDNYY